MVRQYGEDLVHVSQPPMQLTLPFLTPVSKDPFLAGAERAEARTALTLPDPSVTDTSVMEAVCHPANLQRAYRAVVANQGSPGVDGMRVDQLGAHLRDHWPTIREQLLAGTYQPKPVKRVMIPKPGGGERALGIPTVLDRFLQQALLQLLQPAWDPTFAPQSYGFRPGRSAHQAVAQAQEYIAEGYRWVVDMDIEKFFDRVHHDLLMGHIAKRVQDRRVLRLIRAFLEAGALTGGLVEPRIQGMPQGGPLSPLLSNLLLDILDQELQRRGHRFVRYADDCNVYVRSARAGQRVLASLSRFLTQRLRLRLNPQKSAVARPWQRAFLGFSFTGDPTPKRRVAPDALHRLKERVREYTRRSRGVQVDQMTRDLARYLTGWNAYFGFCQTPSIFPPLNRWIRKRLRAAAWLQWRRGRRRFTELRKRGVPRRPAAQIAGFQRSVWRVCSLPQMYIAFPEAYFRRFGLPTLTTW